LYTACLKTGFLKAIPMKSLSRSIKEVRVHFRTLIRSIGKELGFNYLIERLSKIKI